MRGAKLSLAALCVSVLALSSAQAQTAALGQPAPAFTLQDQSGNEVSLSDHAGKVVVLEWVNPECPFVVRHYKSKTMKTLAEKYQDQQVVWLAINTTSDAGPASNAKWVQSHELGYPILDDSSGAVGRAYGAKTTPHMYIIDQRGTLVYMGGIDNDPRGGNATPLNYVDKALGELLSGQPISVPESKPYGCSVKFAA
jgi:peroxiredoxin